MVLQKTISSDLLISAYTLKTLQVIFVRKGVVARVVSKILRHILTSVAHRPYEFRRYGKIFF